MKYALFSTETHLPTAQVSHSVLHPDWIAAQVRARYPVSGDVTCFLLYRGMNDVYLVQDEIAKYALRVWRKTYRDPDDVAYELGFLDFLRSRSFPASVAVPQHDGALYFRADTPEGVRAVAMYDWAPGVKFGERLSTETAHRIGAAFARMHLAGYEWAGSDHRFTTKTAKDYNICMPALVDFVYDRPDDLHDYPIIAANLDKRLDELAASGKVPLGVCHRDFHPSNVHVADDGAITLLDFDAAGEDFLMQDVKNFVWGNLFYGFDPANGTAFEDGYQSVRPFTPEEVEAGELFLMAKALRLVAGMAHSSTAVGRGTLRFRNLDWLGDYIKTRARTAGLL
ncbi:phosphotransferase enzyme family protein [Novosphingobium taihuense]|uniref:Ser/Thr protein kinase RdoA (MazF antagonist) n=1 Tax=Novosphingobium taihuense TaxID=260085 RepID=A0A7W7EUW8_9SPHN|nr:phosphotransferase [Novosphingobium taihuense]MBB4614822.1 Ser/Thr protein kinase RdoA (MazF antagonist) [Novosphingobium taihuense]TWH84736.1 Ser/Thr protein kinase RdoA (MazF antagonist) [Novosphingobium taihuense]